MTFGDLAGTAWTGTSELWLDDVGDTAERCDCSVAVGPDVVTYTWSYQGAPHTGRLALTATGAEFSDTWHSPTAMACDAVVGSWARCEVAGTYGAGDGPRWGWRIAVCHRPESDELVILMTNVAPWGEAMRAVRMIARRG